MGVCAVNTRRCGVRFVAAIVTAAALTHAAGAQTLTAPQLKGAYLFNFTLFTEWPAEFVTVGIPLTLCVVNDDTVADVVERLIKGRSVEGHGLTVKRLNAGATLPACHVLYLAGGNLKKALQAIETVKGTPALTVSDAPQFADSGGMVELFVEGSRMRFAVNVDAMQRARVRLSARVLDLAKVLRDPKP
jgi:hypothetical protein